MTKQDFLVRVRSALCIDPTALEMTPEEYAEALDEIAEDVATLAVAHDAIMAEEVSATIVAGPVPVHYLDGRIEHKHVELKLKLVP